MVLQVSLPRVHFRFNERIFAKPKGILAQAKLVLQLSLLPGPFFPKQKDFRSNEYNSCSSEKNSCSSEEILAQVKLH